MHWGAIDEERRLIHGTSFWLASPDERAILVFPEDWDPSPASIFAGSQHPGRLACRDERQNRLYGDIGLLKKVAIETGIRQALEAVFRGD
jgi:hypothetical protein